MPFALKGVSKNFEKTRVLRDFSLEFEDNKVNCILGPSGSGKTTILNILANLTPFEGTVERSGEGVSYIFQNSRLLPNLTVWENVEFVLLGTKKEERIPIIKNLLELTELYEKRNEYPSQLSGGMARRVAMARAYAYPAPLLLMDEPFSALDLGLKLRQMAVYDELNAKFPRTSVFVTHDIDEALLFADSVTVLRQGGEIAAQLKLPSRQGVRDLFDHAIFKFKELMYEILK